MSILNRISLMYLPLHKATTFAIFCLAVPAVADVAPRVAPDTSTNSFYADYSIVENVPTCAANDEIAFEMNVTLEDVLFRAHNTENGQYVDQGFGVTQYLTERSDLCYRFERRGMDRVVITVPCNERAQAARNAEHGSLNARLDIDVTMLNCLSPAGHTFIDGTWEATLTQKNSQTIWSGGFDPAQNSLDRMDTPRATFALNSTQLVADVFWWNRSEFSPTLRDQSTAYLHFQCLAAQFEDAGTTPFHIEASILLFPNRSDAPEICNGPTCPRIKTDDYLARNGTRCEISN